MNRLFVSVNNVGTCKYSEPQWKIMIALSQVFFFVVSDALLVKYFYYDLELLSGIIKSRFGTFAQKR